MTYASETIFKTTNTVEICKLLKIEIGIVGSCSSKN